MLLLRILIILVVQLAIAFSASAQCIRASVGLPGNTEPALLGTSVSIHGDLAVIGAPLQVGVTDWASGRVHVYRFDGVDWALEAELVAEDGATGDMFGISVDTDGQRIVVGAWFEDTAFSNDGAAYVFYKPDESDWILEQKLVAMMPRPEATFGRTVAVDGGAIAIGSPLDSTLGSASGRVHVFEQVSGVWSEQAQLQSPFQQPLERFGLALDMEGSRLAVGASWADTERGAVHIFDRDGDGWSHTQEINDPSGENGDQFGFDVALAGNWLGIGAYKADGLQTDSGKVDFYQRIAGNWTLQASFDGDLFGSEAQFGVSVAMENDLAVVGSRYGTVDGGSSSTGAVSAFRLVNGDWLRGIDLVSPDVGFEAEFGWQVAVSGEAGIVGAPYAGEPVPQTGGAFFLDLETGCGGVPGDLNGDGLVNGGDLGLLLSVFGPCRGCPADLNNDDVVNGGDLGLLLVFWSV